MSPESELLRLLKKLIKAVDVYEHQVGDDLDELTAHQNMLDACEEANAFIKEEY